MTQQHKKNTADRIQACISAVALVFCTGLVQARSANTDGLVATMPVSELPVEGRETYRLIKQGGPFRYDKDGVVFGNRERILPKRQRGYYHEYTVATSGLSHRGARRIVCGGPPRTPEGCFYTSDHYASFRRIVESKNSE